MKNKGISQLLSDIAHNGSKTGNRQVSEFLGVSEFRGISVDEERIRKKKGTYLEGKKRG